MPSPKGMRIIRNGIILKSSKQKCWDVDNIFDIEFQHNFFRNSLFATPLNWRMERQSGTEAT